MKRDIIIIEDKTVSVTGNEVWMTAGEIAEEFHATVPAVNAAIKAVRKSDVLNDYEVCRYIQLENGLYADRQRKRKRTTPSGAVRFFFFMQPPYSCGLR